jgi:small subunit ribosomal protein S15
VPLDRCYNLGYKVIHKALILKEGTVEKEEKQAIIESFRGHDKDTGSSPVQVALVTGRIKRLTEHMKLHPHDYHSRRGLMQLVGQRRRHLAYINKGDVKRYRSLIKKLGLRK